MGLGVAGRSLRGPHPELTAASAVHGLLRKAQEWTDIEQLAEPGEALAGTKQKSLTCSARAMRSPDAKHQNEHGDGVVTEPTRKAWETTSIAPIPKGCYFKQGWGNKQPKAPVPAGWRICVEGPRWS